MTINKTMQEIKFIIYAVAAILCDPVLSIALHLFLKYGLPQFGIKYNLPFIATCAGIFICKIIF